MFELKITFGDGHKETIKTDYFTIGKDGVVVYDNKGTYVLLPKGYQKIVFKYLDKGR